MVLRKIKQLLGMGSEENSTRSDHDVVVQEETSEPDTETEAAVKGVDEEPESEGENAEPDDTAGDPDEEDTEPAAAEEPSDEDEETVDEPVATATDAGASTESLVDEAETQEHPESRAEPAEAAGPGAEDETTDVAEVDPAEEPASPDVDTGDADADGTPVDEVKGIGPAYSDRLAEIGIHSVDQLAAADAEDVAERIAVAEKTVGKWVDRAQDRSD